MRQHRSLVWLISLFVGACGSDLKDPDGNGGSGANPSGGASTGGASTGGASTGGASTGGASTGGASTGGGGRAGEKASAGQATAGQSGSPTGDAGSGTGGSGAPSGGATSGASGTGPGMTGGTTSAGTSSSPAGSGGASMSTAGSGGAPTGPLVGRITTKDVTLPAGVKAGVRNYRIWGATNLRVAPVFIAPRANCGTLVCYTTGSTNSPNARVARLDANDALIDVLDLGAGFECRGLAAEPDGHFGALLWNNANDTIFVKRYDASNAEVSSTGLSNPDNNPTNFGIGESRLEFGGGKYGAYYHVHSDDGHEGDTLKWVNAASGAETTGWAWGCSHSMSNLLTFNPTSSAFLPACVTDCYPGTSGSNFASSSLGGIYLNRNRKVLDVDAGCNGDVAGELGGSAAAPSGWKLVFNAHQAAATLGQSSYNEDSMNQDIGFTAVGENQMPGAVVWLTTTPANEADSAIARWQPADDMAEQYVVGWSEGATYRLARVGPAGQFLEQPADVTAKARWGQRDDPFRQHFNRDVVWAWFEAAGSTTLKLTRLRSGGTHSCAAF